MENFFLDFFTREFLIKGIAGIGISKSEHYLFGVLVRRQRLVGVACRIINPLLTELLCSYNDEDIYTFNATVE